MAQEEEIKKVLDQLTQCEWVKDEFRSGSFGDRRLFYRLLVVAEHFARHPEAPINQASEIWSKTRAAYRFFDNEKVTSELILRPHVQKTIARMGQHAGTVLVIQNTSFLNYSHMHSSTDLGPIGELKDRGLVMHTSLAITTHGLPLGIVDQFFWARDPEEHGKAEYRAEKPIEDKESFKWLRALGAYHQKVSPQLDVVTVCDSEADIYDLFTEADKLNAQFLIRSKSDRRTETNDHLRAFIARKPVAFSDTIHVTPKDGNPKRDAQVEVRFAMTQVRAPKNGQRKNLQPLLQVYIVSIQEVNPPPNQTPLSWFLLTNVPTKNISQVKERIRWYKMRWQIEVFHRILKSGCHVEQARLEKNERRYPYLSLFSIIAWKLLLLSQYNKISPSSPATSLLTQTECDVLYSVTHSRSFKKRSFDAKLAAQWLAQLGGFLARKSDGLPGPTHIWRGWQRLQDFTHMYILTKKLT